MRFLATILWVCWSVCARAGDLTIEERLARLETRVDELRAENAQLRAQLGMQVVAQQANVKPAGSESRLQLGGLLQVQAESGGRTDPRYTDDNDRLFLRRARINVQGRFVEDFDFRAELDLSGNLGPASGLRAQMTDGYVTWTRYPFANVRAGQFKTPFGFEQLYSDTRLYVPERTLGSDRLTLGRQLGVQLSGTRAGVSYAAGAFNGTGTNTSANDDDRLVYTARLSGNLWEGRLGASESRFSAGVNGYTGRDRSIAMPAEFGFASNVFAGRRRAAGADAQFVSGPIELWGEALRARYSPDTGPGIVTDSRSFLAAWMLVPDSLQVVGRIDTWKLPGRSFRTLTGGVNHYIRGTELRLLLHYVHGETGNRVIARIQTAF